MTEKEIDLKKIRKLEHLESCNIDWHQEGGAEVTRVNSTYVVYGIPIHGGKKTYSGVYHDYKNGLNQLIEDVYSWT